MFRKIAASMIIGTVDGSRDLSDSWTGFTLTSLKEKLPDGYMWFAEMTKRQATSRPDQLRSEKYVKEHT